MELIGAGTRSEVEKSAAHLAKLGRKVTALQSELFNRFYRRLRLIGHAWIQCAGRILAFEDDTEGVARGAVHANIVPAVDAGARGELNKTERIANRACAQREIQGKRVDPVAADGGALFRVFAFQQRCVRGDGDRFGRGPDLKRDVDPGGLGNLYTQSSLHELAEARMFNGQLIAARGNGWNCVVAGACGFRSKLRTVFRIDGDDSGGWD